MALMRVNLYSKLLGMYTNVMVHIPSFHQGEQIPMKLTDLYPEGAKYQVLWLLHGGSDDDSNFQNCTNVMRYADENKLAVVVPCDYNGGYTDYPRGPKYFTYIAEELREFMTTYFPISDKREDNFIAGNSMGGGGATTFSLRYPDRFAAAVLLSGGGVIPPKDYGNEHDMLSRNEFLNNMIKQGWPLPFTGVPKDVKRADNHAQLLKNLKDGKQMPKYFITCGTEDEISYKGVSDAAGYMKELGLDVYTEMIPGYKHEWDFWDITLRKAMNEWLPLKRSAIINN